MTDYKQLCAELADSIELLLEMRPVNAKPLQITEDRLTRARAALAEPTPEGPTDEKLLQVFDTACLSEGGMVDEIHLRGLRAVLARWGK